MREIVLDTETTGLDPLKGDRLVEIGCVELSNRFITGQTFHCYLNPQRAMNPDAFKVHGLSDAFLADKPLFADVIDAFLEFIGDSPLVIHNASFDMGFINAELKRIGRPPIGNERVVDTLILARRRYPGVPNTLDALCTRFGIDTSRRTKHGALLDSELLADVYSELSGGRQSSLGLINRAMVDAQNEAEENARMGVEAFRKSLLTGEEEEKHRLFIAEMGEKAIWNRYIPPLPKPQAESPIGQETPVPPSPQ